MDCTRRYWIDGTIRPSDQRFVFRRQNSLHKISKDTDRFGMAGRHTRLWCFHPFLFPPKDELSLAVQSSICGSRFAPPEANIESRDTSSTTVAAPPTHGLSLVAYRKY